MHTFLGRRFPTPKSDHARGVASFLGSWLARPQLLSRSKLSILGNLVVLGNLGIKDFELVGN